MENIVKKASKIVCTKIDVESKAIYFFIKSADKKKC